MRGLFRAVLKRERDLLGLTPVETYTCDAMWLGYSRRSILLVNAPELTLPIFQDPDDIFPKNDVMVDTLEGLVGNSIFVSSGETWRRQRRMVDPAFSVMRVGRGFPQMAAATADYEARLAERAASGTTFSLDEAMSHLTADVICRTIFSQALDAGVSRDVFDDFAEFEGSVANIEIFRLLFDKPFARVPQKPAVRAACARIRAHLGAMLDARLAQGVEAHDDIVSAIVAARDAETGAAFTREELIDQLGVFFLAGHETTASALTWAFFLLAMRPEVAGRIRDEVEAVTGGGEIGFEQVKRLAFTRNVLRETLRLYPPITFLPRVALKRARIGRFTVKPGTMVMISPWTIHRHPGLWPDADRFDPDRFASERENAIVPGSYVPFGTGPRICVGAAFATIESCLIMARLLRRFDFEVVDPARVRPVSRLTTRPAEEITLRVRACGG